MTRSRVSSSCSIARSTALLPLAVVLVAGLFGCTVQHAYGFRPVSGAGESVAGFPATRYALPAEAPSGEVYVAAPEVNRPEGTNDEVVHVRLAVGTQAGGAAWSLDPNRQVLSLPTGQQLRPDYMDAPDGNRSVPFVVASGTQRSLDLFYKLPPGQSIEGNVAGFQLNWEVAIGDRPIAMETPFTREPVGAYEGNYVAVGVGYPWWWYRPFGWGPWYGYGYGPGWGYGWGYGGGYRYGWGGPRVYHSWGAGASGSHFGGWHGGGGGGGMRIRGAPSRH